MSKYLRVMGLCFSLSIFLALVGFARTVAEAGLITSEGDVCDELKGAAYGLCNAYCNAMKCGTDQQKASDTTCERVLKNFRKQSTSPLLPSCDPCGYLVPDDHPEYECPCNFYDIPLSADCWGPGESNNSLDYGPQFSMTNLPQFEFDECQLTQCTLIGLGCGVWGPIVTHNDGNYSCEYFVYPAACGGPKTVSHDISPEQFRTCLCRLEQYAADLSMTIMIYDPSGNQQTSFSCEPSPTPNP